MRRYATPLLLVPVAAGWTLLMGYLGVAHTPAAFLATVLFAGVFFLHSPPQLTPSVAALPFLANFVLFAVLGLWFGSVRQRAEQGQMRTRAELEVRVVERTAELERLNRELRTEAEERSPGGGAAAPKRAVSGRSHIFGFAPDKDMVSREAARERIHPADLARLDAVTEKAMAERSDFRVNHRLVLPDGSTKYVQTLGHPVLDSAGHLVASRGLESFGRTLGRPAGTGRGSGLGAANPAGCPQRDLDIHDVAGLVRYAVRVGIVSAGPGSD